MRLPGKIAGLLLAAAAIAGVTAAGDARKREGRKQDREIGEVKAAWDRAWMQRLTRGR